jgi:glycosyltransferase involved in cell wall biosynthesis
MRIGGVEQNLLRTLPRLLAESKHEHELILSHAGGPLRDKLPDELSVHILPEGSRYKELSRLLRETDLLHMYSINHSPFYRQAAFLHNTASIDNIRNMLSCPAPQRVDAISCASRAIGNMQSAPRRVRIIPNGLSVNSEPDYEKFNSEAAPVLIEIGRPDKIRLLKAEDIVPPLRKSFPNLCCHVLGREGEDKEGIIYHGEVENPRPFYQKAHFLIHYPELEPFGMTVPESYRDGVIPVAGGRGGISEIIRPGETGFYFPKPQLQTVIKKMEELITELKENPSELKKIARSGFELLVGKYSLDAHLDSYEQLYTEIGQKEKPELFPEIEWSDSFCRLFEKISFVDPEDFSWLADLKTFPLHSLERDWLRLHAAGKLSSSRPQLVLDLLSDLETKLFGADFEYHLRSCEALAGCGKLEEALQAAKKAAKNCPGVAEPYFIGCEILLRLGDPQRARTFLQKFKNYAPDYPPLKAMLAKLNGLTN